MQEEKFWSSLKWWDFSEKILFFIDVSSKNRITPSYRDKSIFSNLLIESISYYISHV